MSSHSSTGAASSIDYQYTNMPTGAKNFVLEHVRTRRAPRGCRQPGERGGRQGGAAPSSAETEPRLPPFAGCRGEGLRPPLPPAPPHPDQEIVESRWRMGNVKIDGGPGRRRAAPSSRLCRGPPRSSGRNFGGRGVFALRAQFSLRGENFTPRSRCQKMAKFWGKTAAGHVKKIF